MPSISRSTYLLAFGAAVLASACNGSNNPRVDSSSVQLGELGNGGFTFKCDDTLPCDRWNNSREFPSSIATGSTFELAFYLRDGSRGYSYLASAEAGTTIEAIGTKYATRAIKGFAAKQPGYVTFAARDQKGWLVDYIVVPIQKPDTLVVYDADETESIPTRLTRVELQAGTEKSLRVVAQKGAEQLAGALASSWAFDGEQSSVTVEGIKGGAATIRARAAGTAKLQVEGAGLRETIDVVVTGEAISDAGTDAQDASGGDQ